MLQGFTLSQNTYFLCYTAFDCLLTESCVYTQCVDHVLDILNLQNDLKIDQ